MVGRALRRGLLTAVALAIVAAVVVVAGRAPSKESRSAGGSGCRSAVTTDVLPSWARVGFTEPDPRIPHVVGTHGRITAILFGGQLYAPPSPDVRNKVLWVSRTGADGPLRIDATRAGSGEHAHREIAQGPGPSYVDLPRAGCWELNLRWGPSAAQQDSLALSYTGT
jgi:hypothetical protein